MDAYRTPDDDTRDEEIAALRDELDRMRTTIDRLADRSTRFRPSAGPARP